MQTRHRIPTIFNLSMVDVLCCALGCVILLWLLNLRSARDEAIKVGETGKLLLASQQQLETIQGERDEARSQVQAAAQRLADAKAEMALAEKAAADLKARLALAGEQIDRLTRAQDQLAIEKSAALTRQGALEKTLTAKDRQAATAQRRVDDLEEQLQESDTRMKRLRELADLVPTLRADLDSTQKKLSALEEDYRGQVKDTEAARQRLTAVLGEKQSLAEQVQQARAAAENRFAGITLSGRRVVFLVDMSGSMEMLDEKTAALDKWTGVRETLAKVMRSLPGLEKFQVILFSSKVTFPLGADDRWIDFDAKTSVQKTLDALAAIKPRGDTNMYAALQAAFRLRAGGLDTIYLFSDGLPNTGEGLAPDAVKKLTDRERAELLSKFVRKTLKFEWNRPSAGRPPVRINAVGYFYESPDVGAFLWALARENDGSFVGMSKP